MTPIQEVMRGIAFCHEQGKPAQKIRFSQGGYITFARSLDFHKYVNVSDKKEFFGLPYVIDRNMVDCDYKLTNDAKTIMVTGGFNETNSN